MYFKTPDLEIRPFVPADRERIIDLFTDAQVKKTYMVPDFATREEAGKLFDRLRALSEQEGRYIAAISLNGDCIGILNETEVSGNAIELGYALLPKYHNRGYATQTLGRAMEYLFDRGFDEVLTGAFEDNAPSIRVMEKCGMTRLSRQEEIPYRGKVHRCVYYSRKR